jgi:hypothetical protein
MAVNLYRSTDAGAPSLSGTVGSLIALLDAVLVNGYGAKAAAGWTKAFAAANLAVYRNSAAQGSGHYLSIDDAGGGANGAREANARAAVVATATNAATAVVGMTEPFPTAGQAARGLTIAKSRILDATARKWVVVADQRTFYLFTFPTTFQGWSGFAFGDFFSLRGNTDAYRSFIIGRATETFLDTDDRLDDLTALTTLATGHYTPRALVNELTVAGAIQLGKHGNAFHSATALLGVAMYPNYGDNSIQVAPVHLHEVVSTQARIIVRGRLRGFWQYCHPLFTSLNDLDTIPGSGIYAGKQFLILRFSADLSGVYAIEVSDTWETN